MCETGSPMPHERSVRHERRTCPRGCGVLSVKLIYDFVHLRTNIIPFSRHVVLERDEHQQHENAHPEEARELARPKRDRLSPDPLEKKEDEMPSIEDRDRKEID